VDLAGIDAGGGVTLEGATLNPKATLDLSAATVSGSLVWREMKYGAVGSGSPGDGEQDDGEQDDGEAVPDTGGGDEVSVETPERPNTGEGAASPENSQASVEGPAVNLADVSVGFLDDDPGNWPEGQTLTLEGLSYDRINIDTPIATPKFDFGKEDQPSWLTKRISWLRKQPDETWSPAPYEQLAAALRAAGHESAARKVSIERERDRRDRGGLGPWSSKLNWFLGLTLGHGYRPIFALLWALLSIAVGAVLLDLFLQPGDFRAKENPAPYSPIGYSLDAFLPIINLHQEESRVPRDLGWNVYLWVHIALGWLLTTLAVAGVSGIVRKD
jgi:hypothetical protein